MTLSPEHHQTDGFPGGKSPVNDEASIQQTRNWVVDFLTASPEFENELKQAGIQDEKSYIESEASLSWSTRTALGQYRFDVPGCDKSAPLDIVRNAPPWLLSRQIIQLPLTTRLQKIFTNQGINLVSDLSGYTGNQLFELKNYGQYSNTHLAKALYESLKYGAFDIKTFLASDKPDFENTEFIDFMAKGLHENLLETFNKLNKRDRDILKKRMGFNQTPKTLESIGQKYGITRERIRQIENRIVQWVLKIEPWGDIFKFRLNRILDERDSPLLFSDLDNIDDWFRGICNNCHLFKYLVDLTLQKNIHLLEINGVNYISRIDQTIWDKKLKKARQLLQKAVAFHWSREKCQHAVSAFLPLKARELNSLFCKEAFRLCHFSHSDSREIIICYGTGMKEMIHAVLSENPKPLHTREITRLVNKQFGIDTIEKQIFNPVASVGILLNLGTYGLRQHVHLSNEELETLSKLATEIVNSHSIDRQWHASEILEEILKNEELPYDGLDKYLLNYALSIYSDLKYLGRFVWVNSQADIQDRLNIRESVVQILKSSDGPLQIEEISKRLVKIRGINGPVQIWNDPRIIRMGHGNWGLNDRDIPIKSKQQKDLVERFFTILKEKKSGIHSSEISQYSEKWASVNPEIIFSILALDERFATNNSRFVYLREWGNDRRD